MKFLFFRFARQGKEKGKVGFETVGGDATDPTRSCGGVCRAKDGARSVTLSTCLLLDFALQLR